MSRAIVSDRNGALRIQNDIPRTRHSVPHGRDIGFRLGAYAGLMRPDAYGGPRIGHPIEGILDTSRAVVAGHAPNAQSRLIRIVGFVAIRHAHARRGSLVLPTAGTPLRRAPTHNEHRPNHCDDQDCDDHRISHDDRILPQRGSSHICHAGVPVASSAPQRKGQAPHRPPPRYPRRSSRLLYRTPHGACS